MFARGISSRLTNAFPFGSAVASRESRYCRVVWSMSLPFYVVVYGPNHIFHCLSNILVRDCAVVRNAPLWLSIRDINFLDSVKTDFMGTFCRRVLRLSIFFVADGRCRRKPQSSWHAQSRERCLGLFALGVAARLDIKRCDVQGVCPSISSTRTHCCRGRFSQLWLRARQTSLQYRSVPLCAMVDSKCTGESMNSPPCRITLAFILDINTSGFAAGRYSLRESISHNLFNRPMNGE